MCRNFLGLLMFLGFCLARPSPDLSVLSTPTSTPIVFPAEYLPLWNVSENSAGDLQLPLDPAHYYNLEQRFSYGTAFAGPPRGGQLITSIVFKTYTIWKSMDNRLLVRIENYRFNPFLNICRLYFRAFPTTSRCLRSSETCLNSILSKDMRLASTVWF